MPQFATFDGLSRFNRDLQRSVLLKEASSTKIGKSVFLSHSSKDKEHLPAVISILKNHGGHVYVDSEDDRLPATPNRNTANILRETVKSCRRFVLFVTTNSKRSWGRYVASIIMLWVLAFKVPFTSSYSI